MDTDPRKHPHAQISARWLQYLVMDTTHLRTRYQRRVLRGGSSFFRLARDKMIHLLLEEEFGEEGLKNYLRQCQEWKAAERQFYRDKAGV